jgi:hypothetical protein
MLLDFEKHAPFSSYRLSNTNSQFKNLFKIQCNCSGRDSAVMRSEILLATHIILKLVIFSFHNTVFGCSAKSATGSTISAHSQIIPQ